MSKVGTLTAFLKGMHVMGDCAAGAGLRDYHAAKAVVSAGRKRDVLDQFNTVRILLKNYRVTVHMWQGIVSVARTTHEADYDARKLAQAGGLTCDICQICDATPLIVRNTCCA